MKSLPLVVFLAAAACASGGLVGPRRAQELAGKGALLLDVRSGEEHREARIEGSLLVPVDELASRLGELPKDRPIVVHCGSGRRSARAAGILRDAGYEVYDLDGGLKAWAAEGLPVRRGE